MGIDPTNDVSLCRRELVPLHLIDEPSQLSDYVQYIQEWIFEYYAFKTKKIPASLLRAYYSAFTDLIKCGDDASVDVSYVSGKLSAINNNLKSAQIQDALEVEYDEWDYSKIIEQLEANVARINHASWEDSSNLDDISRVFISILEDGKFYSSQAKLNAAKRAVEPLWEQALFETRYVFPNLKSELA